MESQEQTPKTLIFTRNQKIVQLLGESEAGLHERLRGLVLNSFVVIQEPTEIVTPSWYTLDASHILQDIPEAVMVCTSTCKHEPPFQIFVGRRAKQGWMIEKPARQNMFKENPNQLYIYIT